jgi:hypothetical protein
MASYADALKYLAGCIIISIIIQNNSASKDEQYAVNYILSSCVVMIRALSTSNIQ